MYKITSVKDENISTQVRDEKFFKTQLESFSTILKAYNNLPKDENVGMSQWYEKYRRLLFFNILDLTANRIVYEIQDKKWLCIEQSVPNLTKIAIDVSQVSEDEKRSIVNQIAQTVGENKTETSQVFDALIKLQSCIFKVDDASLTIIDDSPIQKKISNIKEYQSIFAKLTADDKKRIKQCYEDGFEFCIEKNEIVITSAPFSQYKMILPIEQLRKQDDGAKTTAGVQSDTVGTTEPIIQNIRSLMSLLTQHITDSEKKLMQQQSYGAWIHKDILVPLRYNNRTNHNIAE